MWVKIARIILRNRILLLALVALATFFMAYQAQSVRISYQFSRILPVTDSAHIQYENFKNTFGDISNTIVIAVENDQLLEPEQVAHWERLATKLEAIEGISNILAIQRAYEFVLNETEKSFEPRALISKETATPKDWERFQSKVNTLPFYQGLLYNDDRNVHLMMVQLGADMLYNQNIIRIVEALKGIVAEEEALSGMDYKVSGMPYIRMANVKKVEAEVYLFILLTLIVTAIILLLFLKSFRATAISLVVVVIGVVFSFGLIALLDFEITLLSSLIPPLVIVIGIPNCIFLINKYHSEYKLHKNKAKALQRVIRKIGNVTLLTNITTSLGFAAFMLTSSTSLVEFGTVAALNILSVYFISIIIIPIIYSYLQPPKTRHYKHLDQNWLLSFIGFLERTVQHHRPAVYVVTGLLLVIALFGGTRIYTTGNLSDDFSKKDALFLDLKFIEHKFEGVVPLEIVIDTKRPKGVMANATLRDIELLQQRLDSLPNLSKSLAITNFVKFLKQGFYEGNPDFYSLPTSRERSWLLNYLPKEASSGSLLQSMVDSTGQVARVTMQVADMSSPEMSALLENVTTILHETMDSERYDAHITGASVVSLKGASYLIRNLILSLLLAIAVISIMMAFLFGSVRMVLISVLPNLIPLVFTAGLMGFLGIPLKPSTILVFSIAFGISVDDTIHFLAKYRQELKQNGWKMRPAVMASIRETGVSMFYTSIVLLFGFSIFIASEFGGTVALGILVSITLFFAMATNLIVLPSLLLTLDKLISAKDFSESILDDETELEEGNEIQL